jgi:predicted component of type VI protein secretion system
MLVGHAPRLPASPVFRNVRAGNARGVRAELILPDGTTVALKGDTLVGRDAESGIALDDETVSRRHAILACRDERWYVADTGSLNGTFLNGTRVRPGIALQLRHADRLRLGTQVVLFSSPAERDDPDRTQGGAQSTGEKLPAAQERVVRCLCEDWLAGGTLDRLPSNREVAERLGDASAEPAVKSTLRRVYAKAGLSSGNAHEKRRELCREARRRGWI